MGIMIAKLKYMALVSLLGVIPTLPAENPAPALTSTAAEAVESETREADITLADGTVFHGRILSVDKKGACSVRVGKRGVLVISSAEIASILYTNVRTAAEPAKDAPPRRAVRKAPPAKLPAHDRPYVDAAEVSNVQELFGRSLDIENLTKAIFGNDDLAMKLVKLSEDPEILKVLTDESVLKAIEEKRFFDLLTNKKILSLATHEGIRDFAKDVIDEGGAKKKEKAPPKRPTSKTAD